MMDFIFRLLGFSSLTREEAALEILERPVSFLWRPVIVEKERSAR